MTRNQSEDYSRPQDVLVYRETPTGLVATRAIDEGKQLLTVDHCPTIDLLLTAAEALVAQAGGATTLSAADLVEQLALNRGVRFNADNVALVAYGVFDTADDEIGKFFVTSRWLRNFRRFLGTMPMALR